MLLRLQPFGDCSVLLENEEGPTTGSCRVSALLRIIFGRKISDNTNEAAIAAIIEYCAERL